MKTREPGFDADAPVIALVAALDMAQAVLVRVEDRHDQLLWAIGCLVSLANHVGLSEDWFLDAAKKGWSHMRTIEEAEKGGVN